MRNNFNPLVSIVVPVYNGEKCIRNCLDNLVTQTYENIEIVIVNNSSTDSTPKIISEYKDKFPKIISVYNIPFEEWPGGTKAYGYSVAKGDYITSCDADDFMHYKAVELYVEAAYKGDYDIIISPINEIDKENDTVKVTGKIQLNQETAILNASRNLPAKLIKREFYLSHDPIQSGFTYDDAAYHLTVLPYARIGYCPTPVYYYIRYKESVSGNLKKSLFCIYSFDYVLEHLPSVYTETVFCACILQFYYFIKARWFLAHECIKRLKENKDRIEKYSAFFEKYNASAYKEIQRYIDLPDEPMPQLVYINGFGLTDVELQLRIDELSEKTFLNGADIVALNENNCDIHINESVSAQFASGDIDSVAGYFAMKKINETGGIYLGRRIIVDAPFDYVTYFSSFFCFEDASCFSDNVFGGMKENKIFADILKTYDSVFYGDKLFSLKSRIKNILVTKYGVALDGKTSFFKYETILLAPGVTTYSVTEGPAFRSPLHFCRHDFSDKLCKEDSYQVVSNKLLKNISMQAGAANLGDVALAKRFRGYQKKYYSLGKIQKFIVLFILNRNLCRDKVKKKLYRHKILLSILTSVNKILKKTRILKY